MPRTEVPTQGKELMLKRNNRPIRGFTLSLLLAVVALVAAACGTPGDDGAATTATTSAAAPDTTAAATPDTTTGGTETTEPATDSTAAAGDGTVTVGFISPTTGFVAALGTDMQRGWEMYWEQNGDTAGGVTVETVFEDDAGDPEIALTKARRLVEEEQVDIVAGPILANTAYAVAEYVAGQGIPTLHITAADDLTQREADPHVLRVGYTSSQTNFPAGQWAFEQDHQTAVTLCPDYAFGWESCGGFVSAFTESGGEVVEQIWHPLGTQDFSTYVTQIQSTAPDVVFIGSAGGSDAIQLFQAWSDFGMAGTIPMIGNCCFADQVFLREVGAEAMGAVKSFTYWVEGRDSEEVQAFVSAYEDAHGEIPSLYAAGSYMMARVVAEALATTGGQVNGSEFIDAARGVSLDNSLYGPLEFDDYNNVVGPVYVTDIVEREDGTLWAVVDETFEDVSQFWNKSPEEYMENPVFTRDYQGN
ncbi:MAG TPA: ABC transporter substrate-binding protein [Acidimicrobiia bacterium]|nr:ABC transporter substrate-binding protein [Acidimicrobiia bacterium]